MNSFCSNFHPRSNGTGRSGMGGGWQGGYGRFKIRQTVSHEVHEKFRTGVCGWKPYNSGKSISRANCLLERRKYYIWKKLRITGCFEIVPSGNELCRCFQNALCRAILYFKCIWKTCYVNSTFVWINTCKTDAIEIVPTKIEILFSHRWRFNRVTNPPLRMEFMKL